MKNLILITLLLLWFPSVQGQSFFHPQYEKVEYRCQICGKSIYQYEKVESDYGWHDIDPGIFPSYQGHSPFVPGDVTINYIKFHECTDKICLDCAVKYRRITDRLQAEWDKWLSDAIKENCDNRKHNDDTRNADKIESLKNQIRQLRRQMDDLKSGKKLVEPDSTGEKWINHSANYDTIQIYHKIYFPTVPFGIDSVIIHN